METPIEMAFKDLAYLQKHCHAMDLCIRKIADQLIGMLYVNASVSIISTLLFTIYHSQNISKCPPTGKWWHLLCELTLLETALISLSNCPQQLHFYSESMYIYIYMYICNFPSLPVNACLLNAISAYSHT